MDRWTYGKDDLKTDERIERQISRWADGQVDRHTNKYQYEVLLWPSRKVRENKLKHKRF
jgi:hypothetical protein